MRKRSRLLVLLLLASCSNGALKDVDGVVRSADPNVFNIPATPTPTLTIQGRDETEFEVEFVAATLNKPASNFIMRGVPKNQTLVFRLSHPQMDTIISFPIDIAKTPLVTIPALPLNTVTNIVTEIENIPGGPGAGGVDTTAGMILGQLKSAGGGCAPVQSVALRDKLSGQAVSFAGPYYFDASSDIVDNGNMSDSQCNYVIANVLPGVYVAEFLDSGSSKVAEQEVLVLGSNVSFGMDVPAL